MNDNAVKLLKLNLRSLGNYFFYLGMAFLVIAIITFLLEYYTQIILFTSVITGCVLVTAFGFGGWIGISYVGRRIRVLEALEAKKVLADQKAAGITK